MRSVVNYGLVVMFVLIAIGCWWMSRDWHMTGQIPSHLYYLTIGIPLVTAIVIFIIERVQSAREN